MYSQNNEEKFILEAFKDQPNGRLLDIGAFDGKAFSNSLALIEKGWSAVLVEPNPTSLVALINLHGSNPKVEIIGALVTPEYGLNGMHRFFTCNDAVSTTDEAFTELWKTAGVKFRPILVPGVHPKQVINGGVFDFITIDVEDGTLGLVESMLECLAQAKVVCVEHSVGSNTIRTELRQIFVDLLGFKLIHENGENYIFSK